MPPAPLVAPSAAASPYAKLGGDAGVRRLAHRFYELMDELPEAWTIRQMHPESLAASEDRLFDFLSGWLGGPPRLQHEHGPPHPRMRHAPCAIDSQARDEWLLCMRLALAEQVPDPNFRAALQLAFEQMAEQVCEWLHNRSH
ncbi:group II truncated hemoglobin [Hydrogenophaga soli]|nr:group II truncated hemoglobin [Burkholderiaceae bacterium]